MCTKQAKIDFLRLKNKNLKAIQIGVNLYKACEGISLQQGRIKLGK